MRVRVRVRVRRGLGLGSEERDTKEQDRRSCRGARSGLGLGGDYFLQLHTPFPIPRSMQRVRHQGDCQGISAATGWDPTAMMRGRWRLNLLSPL